METDRFNWNDAELEIVAPSQNAVAVYENPDGNVVIRQERSWNEDEDSFVILNKRHVPALIASLQRYLEGTEPRKQL